MNGRLPSPAGLLLLLLLLPTAACYRYVTTDAHQLQAGDEVRARLSQAQARELDPVLLRDARTLGGTVLEPGDPILLQVPVGARAAGAPGPSLNQRILVPRSEMLEVELRSLDRTRTALVVGGAMGLGLGVVIHGLTREAGGDTRPVDPPPAESPVYRIPILRFILP